MIIRLPRNGTANQELLIQWAIASLDLWGSDTFKADPLGLFSNLFIEDLKKLVEIIAVS